VGGNIVRTGKRERLNKRETKKENQGVGVRKMYVSLVPTSEYRADTP